MEFRFLTTYATTTIINKRAANMNVARLARDCFLGVSTNELGVHCSTGSSIGVRVDACCGKGPATIRDLVGGLNAVILGGGGIVLALPGPCDDQS